MTKRPTAIIAEDEAPQREELRTLLARLWPDLEIVAECDNGLDALEALDAFKPDIAFLDIRMPGVSGLEVARRATDTAHVVFVTAYDEFAVKAFEAGAIDYLLKPVRPDRLASTVERLRDRRPGETPDLSHLLNTMATLKPAPAISWITASVGDTIRMISIDDVLSFQAQDKYTLVSTATDSAHIRTPLKALVQQLDPIEFWQVHRNAIVRVAAIQEVKRDDDGQLRLWLKGKADPLRISDAFRHKFRSM